MSNNATVHWSSLLIFLTEPQNSEFGMGLSNLYQHLTLQMKKLGHRLLVYGHVTNTPKTKILIPLAEFSLSFYANNQIQHCVLIPGPITRISDFIYFFMNLCFIGLLFHSSNLQMHNELVNKSYWNFKVILKVK